MAPKTLFLALGATLAATTLAHFEDQGAVPASDSTTSSGDPNANVGDGPAPKAGSPAEAAFVEAQKKAEEEGLSPAQVAVAASAAAAGAGAAGAAIVGGGDAEDDEAGGVAVADPEADTAEEENEAAASGAVTAPGSTPVSTPEAGTAAADEPLSSTSPEESDEPEGSPDAEERAALSSDEDDGSVCFPGSATVELENGDVVRMEDVSVGDMVKVGAGEFSRVFMFTHKMAGVRQAFVTLATAGGQELALTSGHYLYANGALVAAGEVKVGDVLNTGAGGQTAVVAVGKEVGEGLFNPQTVKGDVVVNGVQASTYTTAVEPTFAHAVLAPLRSVFEAFGLFTKSLESGSVLADLLPNGAQAVF